MPKVVATLLAMIFAVACAIASWGPPNREMDDDEGGKISSIFSTGRGVLRRRSSPANSITGSMGRECGRPTPLWSLLDIWLFGCSASILKASSIAGRGAASDRWQVGA
jgi:hypothetical protein